MRKKKSADLFDMVVQFQKIMMQNKPDTKNMYEEVRMMQFKIRPINGEISQLDFTNEYFIEMLWSLGKMEEFYRKHKNTFSASQHHAFFHLFDGIYHRIQKRFQDLTPNEKTSPTSNTPGYALEVFKEPKLPVN